MSDPYSKFPSNLESPAKKAFAITPANDTELTLSTRSIFIGGDGNLNIVLVGDTANVSFVGVKAGTILPLRIKTVHVTGTTATNLVGLY